MAKLLPFVPPPSPGIPDAAERARALDISRSFLVEAPAGSGKTGLLIQRFLTLLASPSVEDPGQVLAITFTRKATAEMLDRVVGQLAAAAAATPPGNAFDTATRPFAEAVLVRDRLFGWNILDNPRRLNIRTIDSLCASIASSLPVLSRGGGGLEPVELGAPLHKEAANRTLLLLGGPDRMLSDALEILLLHRDGNLANCRDLIVSMLATRDQWGDLVPLTGAPLTDEFLDQTILPKLERALDQAICRDLTRLANLIPRPTLSRLSVLASEMGALPGHKGVASPIAVCVGRTASPETKLEHLAHWRALIHLLIKPSTPRDFRKAVSSNNVKFEIEKFHEAELKQIIEHLRATPGLVDALCAIDCLPPATYPPEQWLVTKALFRVLTRALTELQLLFTERGQCDFAEIGLLARTALESDQALEDLNTASGFDLQHLLVDEMQDTSSTQYRFLELLTQRWDGGSQTLFLVGDPKQSIYLFRQARVERFVHTMMSERFGSGADSIPLEVLHLTANFRSRPHLVADFNADFTLLFPAQPDPTEPELIPYRDAASMRAPSPTARRAWHTVVLPYEPDTAVCRATRTAQRRTDARAIRTLVADWLTRPLPPGRTEPWKIAVLVRNRTHLAEIVPALRQPDPIAFRAVEIEPLSERQEILDLLALSRALLHPADRTAWLALLRAPWCGLSLADLHRLAGQDDKSFAEATIFELIQTRGDLLSDDGIARLGPFFLVMQHALVQRDLLTLPQWVLETWQALGGPACATDEALANTDRFFHLLDQIDALPGPLTLPELTARLGKLYAAASVHPGAVDLMTIHGAKGLEWDFVIVPALERRGRNADSRLLAWLELQPDDPSDPTIAHGIVAPIRSRGGSASPLSEWMRSIESAREAAERKRLFYVAGTRAREELHLFAAPEQNKAGEIRRPPDSLLAAAWLAAEPHFDAAAPAALLRMPAPTVVLDLAASTAPRMIQRIPSSAIAPSLPSSVAEPHPLFSRPEGAFAARSFGNAMHAFLELLAQRIASGTTIADLTAEVLTWDTRIAAVLRASGLAPTETDRHAANILRGLTKVLNHPEGQWLLAPHPQATSESALTSSDPTQPGIRLDRSFLAGPTPLTIGTTHLWIIDYKTATHGSTNLDSFLTQQRAHYATQLEAYASQLAATSPPILLALYHPLLPHLDWWPAPRQADSS